MQITKDNIRQKIIIFNNAYLIEESSLSRASKNNKSLTVNSDNPDKEEEDEMELNIILENGENTNFKFKLDENIYSTVDNFCKENNIDQNGKDLILQQIYSKIAELSKQKKENNDPNQEDNNDYNNKNNIENNSEINSDNNNENKNENNNDNNINNYINNNINNSENINENNIDINKVNDNINNINNNINNTDNKNAYKYNKEENKMENNNNSEENKDIKLKNKNKKKIIVRKRKLKDYEIGQRLYERGKIFKVRKQRNLEKLKTEISMNSPRYDFKPKLYNRNIKSTKNNNRNIKIEDRLINLGKLRDQKILRKITEQKLCEEKKSNDLSLTKGKNKKKHLTRNKSADIFNKLYNDKDILKKKAEKNEKIYFKKVFPFKPKITGMAKNMKKDKYREIINKFNEKQQKKKEKILEKEEEEKSNNQKSKEKFKTINIINTKRPKNYFLSKNIKNAKLRSKKPIKNKLYNTYKEENSENDFDEKYKKEIEEVRKKNLDMNANDIIKKTKELKFKEIFNLLDIKKEGFLSYGNISFINIEPKILEALSPLFREIDRNKNKKIFFNEFKNITNESLSKCMLEDV